MGETSLCAEPLAPSMEEASTGGESLPLPTREASTCEESLAPPTELATPSKSRSRFVDRVSHYVGGVRDSPSVGRGSPRAAAPFPFADLSSASVEAREAVADIAAPPAGRDSVERVVVIVDGAACSVARGAAPPDVAGHSPCIGALIISVDVASPSVDVTSTPVDVASPSVAASEVGIETALWPADARLDRIPTFTSRPSPGTTRLPRSPIPRGTRATQPRRRMARTLRRRRELAHTPSSARGSLYIHSMPTLDARGRKDLP